MSGGWIGITRVIKSDSKKEILVEDLADGGSRTAVSVLQRGRHSKSSYTDPTTQNTRKGKL